ncbi:MmgE/PrpD family protein [Nonomuraea cavernae]|uniref:MmgE/PrpD family protein n=1 Tax=Nonomuraea cavernae TaxID=2045107 RepID=UPI0033F01F1E
MTAVRSLVAWALSLTLDEVPDSVRAAGLRHLLDGLGCAAAAVREEDPRRPAAVAVALDLGGAPEASVLGAGRRVSAPAAALANGALLDALDLDDVHAGGPVRASAAVLPVALAVGEEARARGSEVLVAALAGYEAVCRLGAAVPPGLDAASACGPLVSALVASRLYGLREEQAIDALAIAAGHAGGLPASAARPHPGLAAQAGILAARLARSGATGPHAALEEEHGLYDTLFGRSGSGPAEGLGERWEVTRITIRPYPADRLVHASLDAARVLRADTACPPPGHPGRPDPAGPATSWVRAREAGGQDVLRPARSRRGLPGGALARRGGGGQSGQDGAPAAPGRAQAGHGRPATGELWGGRDLREVREIVATVHRDSVPVVCGPGAHRPRTPYEAMRSLPWSVAAMLLDGEVTVRTYRDVQREEVAELARRIRYEAIDPPCEADDQPGRLLVRYADGTEAVAAVERGSGGPGDPDIEDLVRRKALGNGLSPAAVEAVLGLAEQDVLVLPAGDKE